MGGDKNVEEKDRQRNRRGSDAVTMTSKSGHAEKHTRLDASAFASNQLILLEKESLSEVAEMSNAITTYSPSQLQSRGLALLNLVIESVRTGLGGKTYLWTFN